MAVSFRQKGILQEVWFGCIHTEPHKENDMPLIDISNNYFTNYSQLFCSWSVLFASHHKLAGTHPYVYSRYKSSLVYPHTSNNNNYFYWWSKSCQHDTHVPLLLHFTCIAWSMQWAEVLLSLCSLAVHAFMAADNSNHLTIIRLHIQSIQTNIFHMHKLMHCWLSSII